MDCKSFALDLDAGTSGHLPILTRENAYALRSGMVTLAPGADCGEHSTENYEELLIILEGQGEARLTGRGDIAVAGGRALYIPPGTTHNVVNLGTEPLRYVYVVAPSNDNPRQARNEDLLSRTESP